MNAQLERLAMKHGGPQLGFGRYVFKDERDMRRENADRVLSKLPAATLRAELHAAAVEEPMNMELVEALAGFLAAAELREEYAQPEAAPLHHRLAEELTRPHAGRASTWPAFFLWTGAALGGFPVAYLALHLL